MKNVIEFLKKLRANNNKEWFDAHRSEYKAAQSEFNDFIGSLIEAVAAFDGSVAGLQVKDCVYRINRDVRFSKDKSPYKTHFGAFIAPGGRNAGNAGYYFHIEPVQAETVDVGAMEGGTAGGQTGAGEAGSGISKSAAGGTDNSTGGSIINDGQADIGSSSGMLGGHILSAGVYLPAPVALKSIREDILYNSDGFLASLARAEGFTLESYGRLKRVPLGYPADSPMAEYLKMRDDVSIYKHVDDKFMISPGLLERTVAEYKKTSDFVRWLNRAIAYSKN